MAENCSRITTFLQAYQAPHADRGAPGAYGGKNFFCWCYISFHISQPYYFNTEYSPICTQGLFTFDIALYNYDISSPYIPEVTLLFKYCTSHHISKEYSLYAPRITLYFMFANIGTYKGPNWHFLLSESALFISENKDTFLKALSRSELPLCSSEK